MELKFEKNLGGKLNLESFNRTFMELKSLTRHIARVGRIGFNRTFMELKY